MRPKLLIVEDDESFCTQMKWALNQEYEVFLAGDRPSALQVFRKERPDVALLDLGLPPKPDDVEEGFLTLTEALEQDATAKVIVITGKAEREYALEAIGHGAYDFLSKPVQVDELRIILRRAVHVSQLERDHRKFLTLFSGQSFEGMIGASPQMQEVFRLVRKVATTDVPVLIVGENGTGKELVARAIHAQSARRAHPFVPINCGAIPETLLESELFGHEKGAFTGAHIRRKGRIEAAQRGTLFLDEIGELSPALQVKLLRFLQEHRIERVGGREEISVDSRVTAATNADLERGMREGRFREDLYFRLGVGVISLPPLRAREGDIALLANTFLKRDAGENNRRVFGFTSQALGALENHDWPGNVRELENRIKRAVIMAEGRKIKPGDLELASSNRKYEGLNLREARETLEKDLIQKALRRNKGNVSKASTELGVSRPTLYELIEKLQIPRK
jgi:two-component system NtrC family response regulator